MIQWTVDQKMRKWALWLMCKVMKLGRGQKGIKAKVYLTPKQKNVFFLHQYSLPPGLGILTLWLNQGWCHLPSDCEEIGECNPRVSTA